VEREGGRVEGRKEGRKREGGAGIGREFEPSLVL